MSRDLGVAAVVLFSTLCSGCGGAGGSAPEGSPPPPVTQRADEADASGAPGKPDRVDPVIPTISVSSPKDREARPAETPAAEQKRRELLEAMMPLQVMLGQWRGTTQKAVGDFNALDEPEWIWDFQTDRDQPAMVMRSEASPYFRELRLTYLAGREVFHLVAVDPDGKTRTYEGTFAEPAEQFEGDDQKMHVRYKLELTQIDAEAPRDQWQVVFNHQENNRYLVELSERRGRNFMRFDTIATQRQGTSFARSDLDYGEKECIISGGLGTIQVSHNGKSYWVCCTGCKAAFEEDPQSWITEYESKQAGKEAGS